VQADFRTPLVAVAGRGGIVLAELVELRIGEGAGYGAAAIIFAIPLLAR
jgi:hypothetical protein